MQLKEQGIFICPVIPKYHKLLFEDAEKEYQISIDDTQGKNTSANAIKKAFISNSINEINNSKDNYENILLFFKFYRSINLWVRKVKMNKGIFESNNNKIDLENSNELFYKNFNSSIISKPII